MSGLLTSLAQKLYPELTSSTEEQRVIGTANIITILYATPISIIGLIWLITLTELWFLQRQWLMFIIAIGLMFIFDWFSFFAVTELRDGRYANTNGTLEELLVWAVLLIYGPTFLWVPILWALVKFVRDWVNTDSKGDRWNLCRNILLDQSSQTFAALVSLSLYVRWGGQFPMDGLAATSILWALAAISVYLFVKLMINMGFAAYLMWNQRFFTQPSDRNSFLRFWILALGLPSAPAPFAILAAGLYIENGLFIYLYFMVGLVLVAFLARQLSQAGEHSRQRSRQLENLERLGEAILNSPPDASSLPDILQANVPAMFPCRATIWIFPDLLLLKHPVSWNSEMEPSREWLQEHKKIQAFSTKDVLPWAPSNHSHYPIIVAPIIEIENETVIGCIYLELRSIVQSWDNKRLKSQFPAVHSLASQIASALRQAEAYRQTLEYQKVSQELTLAGRIQASFLPNQIPDLPGWQLAVTLLPARATSGDYFDFIPLSDGKLGLLIADVADKGIGPALYMAMSRTLIRTYAMEFAAQPQAAIQATNKRLLQDARVNLFVTLFYGALDSSTGILTYVNAGHNPPYLLSSKENGDATPLEKTGIPIGIDEDAQWEERTIQIAPGDVLLLYTDGITESQNNEGESFDEDLLVETAVSQFGQTAHDIQAAILESAQNFVGNNPQSDDIALMVLSRDRGS